ncbi:microfibril-associated glycoprotein 4-like [Mercenaria mercenaria]|uniref:microfibril-associated glycoprotein 4-like n=1 Tax=Mercenaria mercenaria TaxID=6596 RepID=UPI00234ED04F|nr:microfibril-associated glycoprotein 4-like [Mercenaria mercenaria]
MFIICVKYALERVDSVASRLKVIHKLRRADLAEICSKMYALDNKMNMLNMKKDDCNSERKVEVVNGIKSKGIADYLLKGAAAEKFENIKTREILTNMVKSVADNNTNNIIQLQNVIYELENKMTTLVNRKLLHRTVENMKKQWAREIEKQWASMIESLKSELEIRKEQEQALMNQIDSLTIQLSEHSNGLRYQEMEKQVETCSNPAQLNQQKSGVYILQNGLRVHCDQVTDGGGWTVFQRRKDGSVEFERKWADYKAGFGNLEGEFWLGNDNIHLLTATGNHELRIDMEDFEGNKAYAKYSSFRIKSQSDNYAIEVSGYSGDAGDSLKVHNGREYSTTDRDNDGYSTSCAKKYRGAWWYSGCHHSNLNGIYYNRANCPRRKGIIWYHWKRTYYYSLKDVEMKLREKV